MDVYHKVLAKLAEVTGGKSSHSVDLKDLVKRMEFHGNYTDIYEYLCREGWVAEDAKANFVKITHWGVAEVKKEAQGGEADSQSENSETDKQISESLTIGRDFVKLLENYSSNSSKDSKQKIQAKFSELEKSVKNIIS